MGARTRNEVTLVFGSPEPRPPCTVCGVPYERHGSYPTYCDHHYTSASAVLAVVPRKATDDEIAAWVERNDLGSIKGNDARCAFEDAERHHLTRGVAACDCQTFHPADTGA